MTPEAEIAKAQRDASVALFRRDHASPHARMTALDREGAAYTVTGIILSGIDWKEAADYAVVSHSPEWLELQPIENRALTFYLQMAHVVALEIEEG